MLTRIFCAVLVLVGSAHANSENIIPLRKEVVVEVGQAMIVNGFRGECGKRPANVDPKRTRATKLGTLSVGKWGMKNSGRCGGLTPAIEVIFTAIKKGRETIEVNGDKISVTVK